MVSVILVNYNGEEFLRKCIQSLFEITKGVSFEVILVDNASADNSRELVKREFPQVHLIESNVNLGFSRGNNLGVRKARGSKFLFLNTDTYLVEDSVSVLSNFVDEQSAVAVVGPRLTFEDGSYQLSAGRLPGFAVEMIDKMRYAVDRKLHSMIAPINQILSSAAREVGWVTGACMMVRRDVFEQVKGFDENIFMYYEDKDLCKRILDTGGKIVYLPHTSVVHLLGGSSATTTGATVNKHYRESQLHYYRKHHRGLHSSLVEAYLKITGKI